VLAVVLLLLACADDTDPLERIRAAHERGRFASTLTPLRRLLDRDPNNVEASFHLGVALLRTGQASLAIWPLRRAYESPQYTMEAGLLLASAMLESRTAPDALAVIETLLEHEPEHVGALVLRSRALLATGKLEEGMADTDRVLELDPENLAVLIPRITTLIALRRIDEVEAAIARARVAMQDTEQAIPPDMGARLCIVQGLFRFEKGEPEAAEVEYERCLTGFPEDRLVVSEAVSFYDRLGRPERGTEILEQKLEATQAGVFRIALAQRKGALGDFETQARLLREEAELHPSGGSWFLVADLHVQREEFEPAVEAFEAAIEVDPDPSPMLRFAYADTLVQAGQYDKARSVLPSLEQPAMADLIRCEGCTRGLRGRQCALAQQSIGSLPRRRGRRAGRRLFMGRRPVPGVLADQCGLYDGGARAGAPAGNSRRRRGCTGRGATLCIGAPTRPAGLPREHRECPPPGEARGRDRSPGAPRSAARARGRRGA
jgi:tetratricopeptide (TPR) repeat protein